MLSFFSTQHVLYYSFLHFIGYLLFDHGGVDEDALLVGPPLLIVILLWKDFSSSESFDCFKGPLFWIVLAGNNAGKNMGDTLDKRAAAA